MKKVKVFINCALVLIVIMAIVAFSLTIRWCRDEWYYYSIDRLNNPSYAEISLRNAIVYTIVDTFSLISAIFGVAMIVLFNPSVFHISKIKEIYRDIENQRNENKVKRAERKAAKSAEQKQARIAELEKQLNELKKDE